MREDLKDRERKHFNNLDVNPLAFLENDGSWFKRLAIKFLLSRWDGHLRYIPEDELEGKTVLDACCGNPRIVCWMDSHGAAAFGCDISIKMLTMGSSTGSSYTLGEKVILSPVRWTIADCERLPFGAGSFDMITCFQALHHINHDLFLTECRRVLKPGGRLFISDPNGDHALRRFGTWLGLRLGLLSEDEKASGKDEIEKILVEYGFGIKWCRSINFLSETVFLLEEVLRNRNPVLSAVMRASLLLLYPLDYVLDRTVFRMFPSLAWRNVFFAVKEPE